MLADTSCWCALAVNDDAAQAIITVSTALYIEWGRLGEIGDLYVLPEHRRRPGAVRRAAECHSHHRAVRGATISTWQFYARLGFEQTGRTSASATVARHVGIGRLCIGSGMAEDEPVAPRRVNILAAISEWTVFRVTRGIEFRDALESLASDRIRSPPCLRWDAVLINCSVPAASVLRRRGRCETRRRPNGAGRYPSAVCRPRQVD
jgi:hypothetical protein